jgi:hypothetical protein
MKARRERKQSALLVFSFYSYEKLMKQRRKKAICTVRFYIIFLQGVQKQSAL